jgi:hypothetical protein
LQSAKEENIKVVLLKGLALERTLYGNMGLRQMNDLDLLVNRESSVRLRKILLRNGFESVPMISPLHEKLMVSYGKHLPEMYLDGLSVEIHFKLFDPVDNMLTEKLFYESNPLADNNLGIYVPGEQLFFLYLVKHLDQHEKKGTSQLRLYTDLVVLLSLYHNAIITQDILQYADMAGIRQVLIEKLFILNTIWNLEFPDWIGSLFIEIDKHASNSNFIYFLNTPKGSDNGEEPESLMKPITEITGLYNKLLFIVGYLFPSLSFMRFRYKAINKFIAVFYYPVRWLRLATLLASGKL